MTAEEYLKNEFPHLNNDIVSEKFNKDVFISCMEQYANEEKIKLLEKIIPPVSYTDANNYKSVMIAKEELKTLKNG